MKPKVRVFISVPHRPKTDSRFIGPFSELVRRTTSAGIPVNVRHSLGGKLDLVRNYAVERFLKTDCTHLFFIDDDTIPPPDIVLTLLKRKQPIVSGMYRRRDDPHWPILIYFVKRKGQSVHVPVFKYKFHPPKGLIECDCVGAGCLLIERSVLEKMKSPWFQFIYRPAFLGEDVFFCLRAKQLGYKIMCDTTLNAECLHVVEHVSASKAAVKKFMIEYGVTDQLAG